MRTLQCQEHNAAKLFLGEASRFLLHRASPLDIPSMVVRLFLGPSVTGHRRVTGFSDMSGLTVRSRDGRPVPVEVDGDWIGDVTEAHFGITPGGLTVIA